MTHALIIIPIIYVAFMAFVSSQTNPGYADALDVILDPFTVVDDITDLFVVLGEGITKLANFFALGFSLIAPFDMCMYGSCFNTAALAVFNLFIDSFLVIYFKDQIIALITAVKPF